MITVLLEVDGVPLPVGQPAIVEHLQQRIPDVGVSLLDLVEENHAVGPPANRLGQLPTFVVPDVAREGRR